MKHRLASIDNILRGVLFGGLFAGAVAVLALVALANSGDGRLRTVRAGDPDYTSTASNTEGIPEAVRTDIPPAMLPVPVGTDEAVFTMLAKNAPYATETAATAATMIAESAPYDTQTAVAEATMQAEFAPYATQTAVATMTMQAELAPYATQTALVVNGLTATTVP